MISYVLFHDKLKKFPRNEILFEEYATYTSYRFYPEVIGMFETLNLDTRNCILPRDNIHLFRHDWWQGRCL